MAYFLFVDESGTDQTQSPYEVFGGIAVEDRDLWNLIIEVQKLEIEFFGRRYSIGTKEMKGSRLLNKITFKQADKFPKFEFEERKLLSKFCIEQGEQASMKHIAAFAQAKIEFVSALLELVNRFRCKIFATIYDGTTRKTDETNDELLSRQYIYLFERFYYFLEDKGDSGNGILVLDEFEKTSSQLLIQQIEKYFKSSLKGRVFSSLIIPEPFFVHSDLSTGVQIADILSYVINWSMRLRNMPEKNQRKELLPFVEQIKILRYLTKREVGDVPDMNIWSVVKI
ncbi:MAG: hypothetical protein RL065_519 [Bacteroidota bacterium]